MSETKHTPGPWVFCWDKYGKESEIHGKSELNDAPICIVLHDDVTESGAEEQLANARLIAAAPELLEALKALIDNVGICICYDESERECKAWEMAEAAIAKAEGEQP